MLAIPIFVLMLTGLTPAYAYDPTSLVSVTLTDQHYSAERYVPLEGDYVYLDVNVQNMCCSTLNNEKLWVHFISEATHKEDSLFTWHLQNLTVGQNQVLHLGPFKLRENWNHNLFIGINPQGDEKLANDVNIVFNGKQVMQGSPVLTITAYPPNLFTQIVPIAVGAGIAATAFVVVRQHRAKKNKPRLENP